MSSALVVLALASALGCGLAAGVFFGVSTFLMPALGRLPPPAAITAMQQINIKAINPWFMGALFGTAAACAAMIVATLADWDLAYGPYLLAGGALYLVGTIGVTIVCNVPRNDALAKLEPGGAEAGDQWGRYLVEWTAWNHVRTVAALIAAGLEIAALHVGG